MQCSFSWAADESLLLLTSPMLVWFDWEVFAHLTDLSGLSLRFRFAFSGLQMRLSLFSCLWAIYIFSFIMYLFKSLAHFPFGWFVFILLICKFLYIFWTLIFCQFLCVAYILPSFGLVSLPFFFWYILMSRSYYFLSSQNSKPLYFAYFVLNFFS